MTLAMRDGSLDVESSLTAWKAGAQRRTWAVLWCATKSLDAGSSLFVASLVVAMSLDTWSELERDDDDCLLEAEVERKVG